MLLSRQDAGVRSSGHIAYLESGSEMKFNAIDINHLERARVASRTRTAMLGGRRGQAMGSSRRQSARHPEAAWGATDTQIRYLTGRPTGDTSLAMPPVTGRPQVRAVLSTQGPMEMEFGIGQAAEEHTGILTDST